MFQTPRGHRETPLTTSPGSGLYRRSGPPRARTSGSPDTFGRDWPRRRCGYACSRTSTAASWTSVRHRRTHPCPLSPTRRCRPNHDSLGPGVEESPPLKLLKDPDDAQSSQSPSEALRPSVPDRSDDEGPSTDLVPTGPSRQTPHRRVVLSVKVFYTTLQTGDQTKHSSVQGKRTNPLVKPRKGIHINRPYRGGIVVPPPCLERRGRRTSERNQGVIATSDRRRLGFTDSRIFLRTRRGD